MNWLKAAWSWFTGGGKTVEKVVDMADEAVLTRQEAVEQDSKDAADARAMAVPSHGSWLDVIIDGWNRLPRPVFATWAFGELVGWWNVETEKISAEKMQLIILIVTFYFAGRALLKDLPGVIRSLRAK